MKPARNETEAWQELAGLKSGLHEPMQPPPAWLGWMFLLAPVVAVVLAACWAFGG